MWWALPEGHAPPNQKGDPRVNAALAAKLVYPDLTIREALYLGGFKDEELDVIRDQKHKWRTTYVVYKDMIMKKLKKYEATKNETTRRSASRRNVEELVGILQGAAEDRLEQVFGERKILLDGFLGAAVEREGNGELERSTSRSVTRKRSRDEVVAEEIFVDSDGDDEDAGGNEHKHDGENYNDELYEQSARNRPYHTHEYQTIWHNFAR